MSVPPGVARHVTWSARGSTDPGRNVHGTRWAAGVVCRVGTGESLVGGVHGRTLGAGVGLGGRFAGRSVVVCRASVAGAGVAVLLSLSLGVEAAASPPRSASARVGRRVPSVGGIASAATTSTTSAPQDSSSACGAALGLTYHVSPRPELMAASPGSVGEPAVSGDGRRVAFTTTEGVGHWAWTDTNGREDVYLREYVPDPNDPTGRMILNEEYVDRLSVTLQGGQSNGKSFDPAISGDGHWAVFVSAGQDLVTGENTGDQFDVYIYDLEAPDYGAHLRRVSSTPAGTRGNAGSWAPSVSADGRWVAFVSDATDLVAGVTDTPGTSDVFLWDRQSGGVQLVSSSGGDGARAANGWSGDPSVAVVGGRPLVAFPSDASDLVVGDTNGEGDVFVWDGTAPPGSRISRASVDEAGGQVPAWSGEVAIATTGRVAFSSAGRLDSDDVDDLIDVYVADPSGATWRPTRVSAPPADERSDAESSEPVISGDGSTVAFWSGATNLALMGPAASVVDDSPGADVYVAGLGGQGGGPPLVTTREMASLSDAALSSGGQDYPASTDSGEPAVSADGRYVAFTTSAPEMRGETGGDTDVFLRDRQPPAPREPEETVEAVSLGTTGRYRRKRNESWGYPEAPLDASMSGDGGLVAFTSPDTDLVPGDGDSVAGDDVFLRDTAAGETSMLSLRSDGTPTGRPGASTGHPRIGPSGDADTATFWSNVQDEVPPWEGDYRMYPPPYARDLATATTRALGVEMHVDGDPGWSVRGAYWIRAEGTLVTHSDDGRLGLYVTDATFFGQESELPDASDPAVRELYWNSQIEWHQGWNGEQLRLFVVDMATGDGVEVDVAAALGVADARTATGLLPVRELIASPLGWTRTGVPDLVADFSPDGGTLALALGGFDGGEPPQGAEAPPARFVVWSGGQTRLVAAQGDAVFGGGPPADQPSPPVSVGYPKVSNTGDVAFVGSPGPQPANLGAEDWGRAYLAPASPEPGRPVLLLDGEVHEEDPDGRVGQIASHEISDTGRYVVFTYSSPYGYQDVERFDAEDPHWTDGDGFDHVKLAAPVPGHARDVSDTGQVLFTSTANWLPTRNISRGAGDPYASTWQLYKSHAGGNCLPVPRVTATMNSAGTEVTFHAAASRDPDGTLRSYRWYVSLADGSVQSDEPTVTVPVVRFPTAPYDDGLVVMSAQLEVEDDTYAWGSTDRHLTVGRSVYSVLAGGVAALPRRTGGNQGRPGWLGGSLNRLRDAFLGTGWWSPGVRVAHEHAGTLDGSRQGRLHAAVTDGVGEAAYEFASRTRHWRVLQREFAESSFEAAADGGQGGRVVLGGDCEVASVPLGAPLAVVPMLDRRRGRCEWTFDEQGGERRFGLVVRRPSDGSPLVDVPLTGLAATGETAAREADLRVIRHERTWGDLGDRVVNATWDGVVGPLRDWLGERITDLAAKRDQLTADRQQHVDANKAWRLDWLARFQGWQAAAGTGLPDAVRQWLQESVNSALTDAASYLGTEVTPWLQALPAYVGTVAQEGVAFWTDWLPFGIGDWMASSAGELVQWLVGLFADNIAQPVVAIAQNWLYSYHDYFAAMPSGLRLPQMAEYLVQPLYGIRDPQTGQLLTPGLDTIRDGWQQIEDTLIGLVSMLPDWVNVGVDKHCDVMPGSMPCAGNDQGLRDWLVWLIDVLGDAVQTAVNGLEVYVVELLMFKLGFTQRSFEAYRLYLEARHAVEMAWLASLRFPHVHVARNVTLPALQLTRRGAAQLFRDEVMLGVSTRRSEMAAYANGVAESLAQRFEERVGGWAASLEAGVFTQEIEAVRAEVLGWLTEGETAVDGVLTGAYQSVAGLLGGVRLDVTNFLEDAVDAVDAAGVQAVGVFADAVAQGVAAAEPEAGAAVDAADAALVGVQGEVEAAAEELRDQLLAALASPELNDGIRAVLEPVELGLDATHDALVDLRDEVAAARVEILEELGAVRAELVSLRNSSQGWVWLGWQLVISLYDRVVEGVWHVTLDLKNATMGLVNGFNQFRRDHLGGPNWQYGGDNGLFGVVTDGLEAAVQVGVDVLFGARDAVVDAVGLLRSFLNGVPPALFGPGGPLASLADNLEAGLLGRWGSLVQDLRDVRGLLAERWAATEGEVLAAALAQADRVRDAVGELKDAVTSAADELVAAQRESELALAARLQESVAGTADWLHQRLVDDNPALHLVNRAYDVADEAMNWMLGGLLNSLEAAEYAGFDFWYECFPAVDDPDGTFEPAYCTNRPWVRDGIWRALNWYRNLVAQTWYGPGLETFREKLVRVATFYDDNVLRPVQERLVPWLRGLFEDVYAGDLEDPTTDETSVDVKILTAVRDQVERVRQSVQVFRDSLNTPPAWFQAAAPKIDDLMRGLAEGAAELLRSALPAALEAHLQRLLDEADAGGQTGAALTGPALANAVRQFLRARTWSGGFAFLDRVPLKGEAPAFLDDSLGEGRVLGALPVGAERPQRFTGSQYDRLVLDVTSRAGPNGGRVSKGSAVLVRPVPAPPGRDPNRRHGLVVAQHAWGNVVFQGAPGLLEDTDGAVQVQAAGPCVAILVDETLANGEKLAEPTCVWTFDSASRQATMDMTGATVPGWTGLGAGWMPPAKMEITAGAPGPDASEGIGRLFAALGRYPAAHNGLLLGGGRLDAPYAFTGPDGIPQEEKAVVAMHVVGRGSVEGPALLSWVAPDGTRWTLATRAWRDTSTGFDRDARMFQGVGGCDVLRSRHSGVTLDWYPFTVFGSSTCTWGWNGATGRLTVRAEGEVTDRLAGWHAGWHDILDVPVVAGTGKVQFLTEPPPVPFERPVDLWALLERVAGGGVNAVSPGGRFGFLLAAAQTLTAGPDGGVVTDVQGYLAQGQGGPPRGALVAVQHGTGGDGADVVVATDIWDDASVGVSEGFGRDTLVFAGKGPCRFWRRPRTGQALEEVTAQMPGTCAWSLDPVGRRGTVRVTSAFDPPGWVDVVDSPYLGAVAVVTDPPRPQPSPTIDGLLGALGIPVLDADTAEEPFGSWWAWGTVGRSGSGGAATAQVVAVVTQALGEQPVGRALALWGVAGVTHVLVAEDFTAPTSTGVDRRQRTAVFAGPCTLYRLHLSGALERLPRNTLECTWALTDAGRRLTLTPSTTDLEGWAPIHDRVIQGASFLSTDEPRALPPLSSVREFLDSVAQPSQGLHHTDFVVGGDALYDDAGGSAGWATMSATAPDDEEWIGAAMHTHAAADGRTHVYTVTSRGQTELSATSATRHTLLPATCRHVSLSSHWPLVRVHPDTPCQWTLTTTPTAGTTTLALATTDHNLGPRRIALTHIRVPTP